MRLTENQLRKIIKNVITEAKISIEMEDFVKACEDRVDYLVYEAQNKRRSKNNVIINVISDFKIINFNPDNIATVTVDFTMTKEATGRRYNIERDGNLWFNHFYAGMTRWYNKFGDIGNSMTIQRLDKYTGRIMIPIPYKYVPEEYRFRRASI